MADTDVNQVNKTHNRKKDKYKKKKDNTTGKFQNVEENNEPKEEKNDYDKAKARNPKAFALNSFKAAERTFRRTQDIKEKRNNIPEVDRSVLEPPPIVIAIVGPPSVGKSTLMQNLIKNYTRQKLNNIKGPVTVVSNKNRRLTFIECNNDLVSMIDVAKVADLVLLMIDSSFGFEMETFEFLNICQVHGMPRIMGVLTHMDLLANHKQLKKIKKRLKHRFWTEIYQGAKLFYLTGIVNNEYRKHEVHNLARFISVMKFKDLGYRANHSFMIADRIEDLTQPDLIRQNPKSDRTLCFYGYVRGCALKKSADIHIPGSGDYTIDDISFLSDPCPLPTTEKKRTLDDRDRLVYAPFSGVGGLTYDKDAVYIELGGSHSFRPEDQEIKQKWRPGNQYFDNIISSKKTIDSKLAESKMKIFSNGEAIGDLSKNENARITELISDGEELQEQIITKDSTQLRMRQRVGEKFFASDSEDGENDDENIGDNDVDENDEECDDEEDFLEAENKDEIEEDETDKLVYEDEDSDSDENLVKWKDNMKLNAQLNFEKNKITNWNNLVYGKENKGMLNEQNHKLDSEDDENDFFKIREFKKDTLKEDNSKYLTKLKEFDSKDKEKNADLFDSIKDCFVTGQWEADKDASQLLENDDDAFGDFEDLDADRDGGMSDDGFGNGDEDEDFEDEDDGEELTVDNAKRKKTRNELTKREKLILKKRRLKEKFNADFDEKMKDKNGVSHDAFYEAMSHNAQRQTELNRLEFEKMDESMRVEYEGFKAGMYVRVEIKNMPYEFIKNFDARYLAILGSLITNEANIGCVTVRLKKHRWHNTILKTKNPLIISLGWRRFQTIPIYYIQDHNARNRYLKYTPQHMYCHATFWGPITPPNTGFIAFQSLGNGTRNFRVSATGVVVDMNKSIQIVKKLKLIGTPLKIFRKTAFITGMFSSVLEASKFEGASIKTVSGIRGQIKKALHSSQVPKGSVRATFEDKILASDTIFLRSWFAMQTPKFYAPVTNLLDSLESTVSVKPLSQLKKEKEIRVTPNVDSLYKPITREERVNKPFKVQRHIEEKLPFQFKTKTEATKKNFIENQRVAVIKEPHEVKIAAAMSMLKKVYNNRKNKQLQLQVERQKLHKKQVEKVEAKRLQKSKEAKKIIYRRLGKEEKRKSKGRFDD